MPLFHSAQVYRDRYFRDEVHPYTVFERQIELLVKQQDTVLDIGAGRTAPVLRNLSGKAARLVAVDLESPKDIPKEIEYIQGTLDDARLSPGSVDLIICRSVLEHVSNPDQFFAALSRVLRSNGRFLALTSNAWDYAAVAARVIPNRFHPWIVNKTEGRQVDDVFPVRYQCNTRSRLIQLAGRHGFNVQSIQYLGVHPAYLMFSGPLFLLGAAYEKLIDRFSSLHFLRSWLLIDLRRT